MDTSGKFSCTFLMKQTFPPFLPNLPIKIKATAEIDAKEISFVAIGPGKTVASQPLANIDRVMVQPVSVGAQRIEILVTTLARLGVMAVLFFLWTIFSNASNPVDYLPYYVLVILIALFLILPLSLLLSGILSSKQDVLRFHFNSPLNEKLLRIEVEPAQESEVRQALLSAGLKFGERQGSREVWECDQCGAVVDADAAVCPNCGAKFDGI